jgi:hypothetical protein
MMMIQVWVLICVDRLCELKMGTSGLCKFWSCENLGSLIGRMGHCRIDFLLGFDLLLVADFGVTNRFI